MSFIKTSTKNQARRIYTKLFGPPKTHQEWAESFNKIELINQELGVYETNFTFHYKDGARSPIYTL